MSNLLFIDDEILTDSTKWGENREIFQKALTECIETNYADDAQVYNLFTPAQRNLLDAYYKGFSREMYKELNGTVALQIQKRNENVKKKLQKLGNDFGMKLDADAWEYDGLKDVGKGAGAKCDLCPHPIRYVHYAVNKQTHECLQFGCNCAADFFAMDKGRLQSMHSIQANMLKDIRVIACVKDKHLENDYYKYSCGHFGRVYLENGIQGLKELVTFKVFWVDKEHLQGDTVNNIYAIQYGTGTVAKQPLEWIKQHIVHCVNADLDGNAYKSLTERKVVPMQEKDITERQKNTAQYISYAIKFIEAGVPVPPSIAKQVNTIVVNATRQHHPDYIKYAQDLLMQKNLSKSSLLRTAFTEFIVDYLASTARKTDRDPETACWGIKGPKTFYNTVLDWEAALTKLMLMADCDKLVTNGYITEKERQRYWRLPANIRMSNWCGNATQVTEYTALCSSEFLNNSTVTRDSTRLRDGLSKYDTPNSKAALVVDTSLYKGDKPVLNVSDTPYKLALCFLTYQNGFKQLIQNTIVTACKILEGVQYTADDTELLEYFYSVNMNDSTACNGVKRATQGILTVARYNSINAATVTDTRHRFYKIDYEDDVNTLLKQYKDLLPQLRSTCMQLYNELMELYKTLRGVHYVNVKKSDINNDYEALMSADRSKSKNTLDYFTDYCKMLNGKRNTETVQQYQQSSTFLCLLAYKRMKPYTEMLQHINKTIASKAYKQVESELYTELHYQQAYTALAPVVAVDSVEAFARYVVMEWLVYHCNIKLRNELCYDKLLSLNNANTLYANMAKYIDDDSTDSFCKHGVLSTLVPIIRTDCATLHRSIKLVYTVFKPNLTVKELITLTETENTYNKNALAMALTVQDIINAIGIPIKPFENAVTPRLTNYLEQLEYFPSIAGKLSKIHEKLKNYMQENGEALKSKVTAAEQESRVMTQKLQEAEHLRAVLDEHIKFFEVNVTDALKHKYHNAKETAIRRREAFKLVKFETGVEELKHYLHEINAYGLDKITVDERAYVEQAENLLVLPAEQQDKQQVKALVGALRSVLYNNTRIYNHFELTHTVLQEFANIDFIKMSAEDVQTATNILDVYYLCATDVDKLYALIHKYCGVCKINYAAQVTELPKAEMYNVKEVYESLCDKADDKGLTGLQKAEQVFAHSVYNTKLNDFEKKVVKTVHVKQTCSAKQLQYVDSAYNKLFGTEDSTGAVTAVADTVDSETESTINTVANVDLAVQIMNHPDFDTLPDMFKRVVATVANSKTTTPKCSRKQLYYVEKAKATLKI